ncbi:MAG: hypothetical protein KJZ96_06010 [Rhodocyclaceae bacterium]|jgi:hypothetical protein|nr:hypothetical protein [Rhodocyclaceae bacterium]MCL4757882.1 hypothetical protein [Rhodocyclaceae bacterium]
MPRARCCTLAIALLNLIPLSAGAQPGSTGHTAHSPYAGMERRAIKSLSQSDLDELRRGGGWGLALPAELNGYPGPAHLLELKDRIPLNPDQITRIETLHAAMRAQAVPAGERLIAAEAAIERAFAARKVDPDELGRLLASAEAARTELRFIHLSRHLETVDLLSAEQVERYQALRGYASDPCESVPDGHDPAMYRRHMGCS